MLAKSKVEMTHPTEFIAKFQTSILTTLFEMLKTLKKGVKEIDTNSSLQEDLSLSSLEMISILTDLCETFEVDITSISDVDLARLKKVADIANLMTEKKDKV